MCESMIVYVVLQDDAAMEKCRRYITDRYKVKGEDQWAKKRAIKSIRCFSIGQRLQRLDIFSHIYYFNVFMLLPPVPNMRVSR